MEGTPLHLSTQAEGHCPVVMPGAESLQNGCEQLPLPLLGLCGRLGNVVSCRPSGAYHVCVCVGIDLACASWRYPCLCCAQANGTFWESPETLLKEVDLYNVTQQSMTEYLQVKGTCSAVAMYVRVTAATSIPASGPQH